MRRRDFIMLWSAAILWPRAILAQQPAHHPLIGVLSPITREAAVGNIQAFRQALRDLGYFEGENIAVEYRFAGGRSDALLALAAELVALKPDVIVAGGSPAIDVVRAASASIPLVVIGMAGDPVKSGWIASFARPGGTVTGMHLAITGDMIGKRISLLKELRLGIKRIGIVFAPGQEPSGFLTPEIPRLEHATDIDIRIYTVSEAAQLEATFAAAEQERVDALCVVESVLMNANRERVVGLAERLRRPAIYGFREFVISGGLMSYGASLPDGYRRAAGYADKILKGAAPGDLPIDQAMRIAHAW